MNTLEYSDEQGKVLAAALSEWRFHLSMALTRIPADAQIVHAPDRAVQLIVDTVDELLSKLQGPDRIEATSKAGKSYIPVSRDGEEKLPYRPGGVIHGPTLTQQQSREYARNIELTDSRAACTTRPEPPTAVEPEVAEPEVAESTIRFPDEPVTATVRKYTSMAKKLPVEKLKPEDSLYPGGPSDDE